MLTIRYTVLLTFTFNILLTEFGAADFSGTGAALGNRATDWPDRDGVGGSRCRATAMCADLGARTIREDLDALRVMGVNPIQALAVPRVLAATLVSLALFASDSRRTCGRLSVLGLHRARLARCRRGGPDPHCRRSRRHDRARKAALFGLSAGMIACYKGISVGGGPAGVGNAVNETVVSRCDRLEAPFQFPWLKSRFGGAPFDVRGARASPFLANARGRRRCVRATSTV